MPLPVVLKVGGAIASSLFGASASSKRRKAERARREIARINTFQQRRKFINDFLTVQGQTLAAASTSGIDISSSGTQGQMASLRTQATTGLIEQNRQDALGESAFRNDQKANRLVSAGNLAGTLLSGIGDILES